MRHAVLAHQLVLSVIVTQKKLGSSAMAESPILEQETHTPSVGQGLDQRSPRFPITWIKGLRMDVVTSVLQILKIKHVLSYFQNSLIFCPGVTHAIHLSIFN